MVSSLSQSQEGFKEKNDQKLEQIRHTCAHIMAMAIQKLFPGTKVAIETVTNTGLYYDFDVFRAKGILWFSDSELRHIFQLSGPRYQLNADEWYTTNRQNQLVFIGRNLDKNEIHYQLNNCLL